MSSILFFQTVSNMHGESWTINWLSLICLTVERSWENDRERFFLWNQIHLLSGGIDDLCLKMFTEAGAMGVRRCKKADLKRIAKATGGTVVVTRSMSDFIYYYYYSQPLFAARWPIWRARRRSRRRCSAMLTRCGRDGGIDSKSDSKKMQQVTFVFHESNNISNDCLFLVVDTFALHIPFKNHACNVVGFFFPSQYIHLHTDMISRQ